MKAIIMAGTLAAGMCLGSTAVMAEKATAPDVEKTFTVAEGSAIPAAEFQFIAESIDTTAPDLLINNITYTANDADSVKTVQILSEDGDQLTGADFPHAGVYKYTVKETNDGDQTPDQNNDEFIYDPKAYRLNIYVQNTGDTLEISQFEVLNEENEKEDSLAFKNTYKKRGNADDVASLTITKKTTGTYADKTKDFSFTITIWPSSTETEEDIVYIGKIGTEEIKVPADGETEVGFTLRDGESLVFENLPAGTRYLVTEIGAKDGYTPSVEVIENGSVSVSGKKVADEADLASNGEDNTNNLVGENENRVVFTNTYEDITPTGIILNNLPFVILIGTAAAGFIAYVVVRRKIAR